MKLDVVTGIIDFLGQIAPKITEDVLFAVAIAVEALIIIFFLVKSAFSYEACLNRSLKKTYANLTICLKQRGRKDFAIFGNNTYFLERVRRQPIFRPRIWSTSL